MSASVRRVLAGWLTLLALVGLRARAVGAQDTTTRGVRIGLTYSPGTRPGIAVLPVAGAIGPERDSVRVILQRDFDYGDRMTVVARTSEADTASPGVDGGINYRLWAQLGAAALVKATVTRSGLHVALHDVARGQVIQTGDFPLPHAPLSPEWRLALHGASDELERWIVGTRGIAQTRILYVRSGRVYVIDSDGAGDTPVTPPGTALSPAWSPDGERFAYARLGNAGSEILVQEMRTGRSLRVSTEGGLNITPEFAPDGRSLVWAHGRESGTDLVIADVIGGATRAVTVGRGTDNVSPSFSPDGRRIAFTSGRAGHPEVYVVDADGTNAELLTPFEAGEQVYRSNPSWSPDGRLVAFQAQIRGRFQILTINLRDRSMRHRTSEGQNEDPAWAPDGRHLIFSSTRTGSKHLYVLDIETGRVRQLTRVAGARLPAWSRHLGASAP